MSPKDALRKWNESNPTKAIKFSEGRGRLSREAVAKCTELAGKGWSISGYIVQSATNTSTRSVSEPVVKKVAPTASQAIAEYVIFWDEHEYKALDKTKKEWSMRNCCNACRVSLVQCHCGKPTIFGDIPVTIVRR
jgi:hypothetical protein